MQRNGGDFLIAAALFLLLLLYSLPSLALQPVETFVAGARQRNPDALEARANLAQEEAQADSTLGRVLPGISARGSYTRNQYSSSIDIAPPGQAPQPITVVPSDQWDGSARSRLGLRRRAGYFQRRPALRRPASRGEPRCLRGRTLAPSRGGSGHGEHERGGEAGRRAAACARSQRRRLVHRAGDERARIHRTRMVVPGGGHGHLVVRSDEHRRHPLARSGGRCRPCPRTTDRALVARLDPPRVEHHRRRHRPQPPRASGPRGRAPRGGASPRTVTPCNHHPARSPPGTARCLQRRGQPHPVGRGPRQRARPAPPLHRTQSALGKRREGNAMTRSMKLLLLGALALASACKKVEGAQSAPQRPAPPVSVATAVERDVPVYLDEIGKNIAPEVVTIQAQVPGRITGIHVKDGATVKRGDLLFTIDPRPYRAQLDSAEASLARNQAELELAKLEFGRVQKLLETDAISQQDHDSRKSAVAVALAQ